MRKLRFISVGICVAMLLLVTACASQEGPTTILVSQDFPHYKSVEGLSEKADAIIKGKVVNTRVEAINDMIKSESKNEELNPSGNPPIEENIYTVYTIEIEEAFKGNYKPGDKLDFKELGGQIGDLTLVAENSADISSENEYIFFLATYVNTPASLLNSIQSLYLYEPADNSGANTKVAEKATITSVNSENDLTLNLNDLKKIYNKYN